MKVQRHRFKPTRKTLQKRWTRRNGDNSGTLRTSTMSSPNDYKENQGQYDSTWLLFREITQSSPASAVELPSAFWFRSRTRIVGFFKLEKQILLFFSSTVVTKYVLLGAPNKYSVISPVLVSILTPPARFWANIKSNFSGRYMISFLRAGLSLSISRSGSLVAGMATNSYPFSLSLRLSPQPKRLSVTISSFPSLHLHPPTQYLLILCKLNSEKMIDFVDLSQTMPLGKVRSARTTAASLLAKLKEMIFPFLCLSITSLLANFIDIVVASVMQMIWFSSSMQRLFKAAKSLPLMLFKRKVGVLVAMSNLINPPNSLTKYRVLSSLVMMIPQIPPVLLKLQKIELFPAGVMMATVPFCSPVQIVPSFDTAMSSGNLKNSSLVMTCACSKNLGTMWLQKVVSSGGRVSTSGSNCEQSIGH